MGAEETFSSLPGVLHPRVSPPWKDQCTHVQVPGQDAHLEVGGAVPLVPTALQTVEGQGHRVRGFLNLNAHEKPCWLTWGCINGLSTQYVCENLLHAGY